MTRSHCYTPLSPATFLERSARAFPQKDAVVLTNTTIDYAELRDRARRLRAALIALGARKGDCIGLLSDNSLQVIEAHFAVPAMLGQIASFNPWLSSDDIRFQMDFCDCRILIACKRHYVRHRAALTELRSSAKLQRILLVDDDETDADTTSECGPYERFVAQFSSTAPLDDDIESELAPLAVNFTSGTTGKPKGVTFSHRAAYLQAIGQVMMMRLSSDSNYFWSLPMFHGNGWFHIWANVAVGAKQIVVLLEETGTSFCEHIIEHQITHFAGAPRLIRRLIDERPHFEWHNLTVMTGGAAPPTSLISGMKKAGVRLIHQYGLNETCATFVVCEEQSHWASLDHDLQIQLLGRQGVPAIHAGTRLRVVTADDMDVPWDAKTPGEVIMAGNTVALGYYKNPDATAQSFSDGWFRSGDMAVIHPDGYIEIKDRIKDMIYVDTDYGWLNISSMDVERSIGRCVAVKDVAVVGLRPDSADAQTGKLVAFVELRDAAEMGIDYVRSYCEQFLGVYERPHHIFASELPKTATGKVQKHVLEIRAKQLATQISKVG